MGNQELLEVKDGDLVMVRVQGQYGFINTWWRVMLADTDGTFIGALERIEFAERHLFAVGDVKRWESAEVQEIASPETQFCYGDKVTTCKCKGLCQNK